MKVFRLLPIVALLFSAHSIAQKIGVVDTNYILGKMPQYKDAEQRMNSQISQWQTEIQTMQAEYEKKKAALENEKVLLVGDQLKLREKEVDDLDKKIKSILNSRFGAKGEINNVRSNLAKPFQDQIWNAIKTVSEKNSLGIILDKNDNNVLFLEKRYDYTEKVLNLLTKNDTGKKDTKPNSNTTKGTTLKNSGTPSRNTRAVQRENAMEKADTSLK